MPSLEVENFNMSPVGPRPNGSARSNVSIITPPPVGNNTANKISSHATNCSRGRLKNIAPKPSDGNSPVSGKLAHIAPKPSDGVLHLLRAQATIQVNQVQKDFNQILVTIK
uniref:Uncharacterized protein n=1 Tax=Cacopsylla melanoneura TaxID=428564 RepID=A0A8D9DX08_9HEMI